VISLEHAIVYDLETFPNAFTMNVIGLHSELDMTFEISEFRDDRAALFQWIAYWQMTETPMVGFNSLSFDYPVLHFIYNNQYVTVGEIYDFAMEIINDHTNRWGNQIWQDDRVCIQVDLLKLHHFDNPAKRTSLKALEVNMRSETVLESPVPFGTIVTREQIDHHIIPYNRHDVRETRKFAHISMDAINFRIGLSATIKGDVLNFADTKIGSKILEQRLGDEVCYTREYGSRQPRQTPRDRIALNDIIFPYIRFNHPEFNRVLVWMRTQTLTANDLTETIQTKGVFTGVSANVGGVDFIFGTGGIHASVTRQKFASDDNFVVRDIDVIGLYPRIAIVNRLYPEHLGEAFVREYSKLPEERALHKKGTVENALFKLASNGTYGNSNNKYSVFYDPRFTMAITINGQLMLCMLAELLFTVPSLQIIQANTDGITYRVHRSMVEQARALQAMWEAATLLKLEEVEYSRMWIANVNNYVSETTTGKLKLKGDAYWYPEKFPEDMNTGAPAWHKDLSALVINKAAVAHMVHGTDIERFIYGHGDKFDFMCRAKVNRSDNLMIGSREVQRITRYYIATNGEPMRKISPPAKGARVGDFKRRSGLSDSEWVQAGTEWDTRYHTKNKSRYEIRETSIESGFLVAECNRASDFDFSRINYDYYIERARKLVI
jgi:hypothetical protein